MQSGVALQEIPLDGTLLLYHLPRVPDEAGDVLPGIKPVDESVEEPSADNGAERHGEGARRWADDLKHLLSDLFIPSTLPYAREDEIRATISLSSGLLYLWTN